MEVKSDPHSDPTNDGVCVVCGEAATGYHYNALSCEGCKGFFRRSVSRAMEYRCAYNDNCEMDAWMRRKCKACRYKRCILGGMRADYLSLNQSANTHVAKRFKRPHRTSLSTASSPVNNTGNSSCSSHRGKVFHSSMSGTFSQGFSPPPRQYRRVHEAESPISLDRSVSKSYVSKAVDTTDMKRDVFQPGIIIPDTILTKELARVLTAEHCRLINFLTIAQERFELPMKEEAEKIMPSEYVLSMGLTYQEAFYYKISNYTVLMAKLVVNFARRIPYFLQLDRPLQLYLIKNSSGMVAILRASRRFNPITNALVFPSNEEINLATFVSLIPDHASVYEDMFGFCRMVHTLELDNAEFAILCALSIYSEPSSQEMRHKPSQKICETMRTLLLDTLHCYTKAKTGGQSFRFARIVGVLLSRLIVSGYKHQKMINQLYVEGRLPPLLQDFFTAQDQELEIRLNRPENSPFPGNEPFPRDFDHWLTRCAHFPSIKRESFSVTSGFPMHVSLPVPVMNGTGSSAASSPDTGTPLIQNHIKTSPSQSRQ